MLDAYQAVLPLARMAFVDVRHLHLACTLFMALQAGFGAISFD